MFLLLRLKRIWQRYIATLSWPGILFLIGLYGGLAWFGLWLTGENALLEGERFLYWLITTGTTVGYGDLTPSGAAGRLFVALFAMPFGVALFALLLGKASTQIVELWQRRLRGKGRFDMEDHVVLFGWQGEKTRRLVEHLLADRPDLEIVLCADRLHENPLPGKVNFVRIESYCGREDSERAAVSKAKTIIVDAPTPETTVACAIHCRHLNAHAHLVVHLDDEDLAELLRRQAGAEIVTTMAAHLLARAALDPGSSRLYREIILAGGITQYTLAYPEDLPALEVGELTQKLKISCDALLIGLGRAGGQLVLNPPKEMVVVPGKCFLYYLARRRLTEGDLKKALRGVEPCGIS